MKVTGGFLIAVLFGAMILGWNLYGHEKKERQRLVRNQSALLSDIEHYKIRDSLNAASIQVLTLRSAEFENHFDNLSSLIRELGVKLRRVETVSETAIQSQYEVQAPVKDTIIIVPDTTLVLHGRKFNYANPHITLHGLVVDDEFFGSITTTDTLTQVLHRVPRRFLFIKWGTKEFRQEMVNSNPHSTIIYNRTLKIYK